MNAFNTSHETRKWVLVARGVIAIILGIFMMMHTEATIVFLYFALGYYLIIEGFIKFYWSFVIQRAGNNFWPTLIVGLISLAAGVLVFYLPGLTAIIVIALLITHIFFQGGMDIYLSITTKDEISRGEFWLYLIGGIAQLLFGLWMLLNPIFGGLALTIIVGIYAIVIGIVYLIQAFFGHRGGNTSGLSPA